MMDCRGGSVDPVVILEVSVDHRVATQLARVLGVRQVGEMTSEIIAEGDRFTERVLEIQKHYQDRCEEILAAKVIRIDKA